MKQRFLALSAEVHPDRVHGASPAEKGAAQRRYAELNAAYQRLRAPKERLQHLLELEGGGKPEQVQRIPPELMEMSMEIAQACRQADTFLEERNRTTSPLLQVQLFERGQELMERLRAVRQEIESRHAILVNELKRLDSDWGPDEVRDGARRRSALPRLEELWRLFGYFARWTGQIEERLVQISL